MRDVPKALFARETIETITDIIRLQHIEHFHRSYVDELSRFVEENGDAHAAELLECNGFEKTIAELKEDIQFHEKHLIRVAGRILELMVAET